MQNFFFGLSIAMLALAGCQKVDQLYPKGTQPNFEIQNEATLQVTGPTGEAIAGAKVLIGDASSARPVLTTDSQGRFTPPAGWKSVETVSIVAPGFIRASFYNQTAQGQKFQLRKIDKVANLEVKGVATGFGPYTTEKDGNVDFALVLPMLKKEEIYFFNESNVISNENDYIDVFGQRIPVPTNISLPQQKEKYGFFTFTLDKPNYRLKVSDPGVYQVMAIRARTTVKALKDRLPPIELLNEVIIGGGSERTVNVSEQGARADFAIGEMQFNSRMAVTAPDIPAGMVMLTMPLIQSAGLLYPSDVKSLKSRESRQLTVPATGATDLFNVVTAPDRIANPAASANLSPITPTSKSIRFLGLLNRPMGDMQKVVVNRPTLPNGAQPGGMYITLSKVDSQKLDEITIERTTRLWELYVDTWQEQIQLPKLPPEMGLGKAPNDRYRWEVSFMASDKNRVLQDSRDVIANFVQDITYVTRNSFDF